MTKIDIFPLRDRENAFRIYSYFYKYVPANMTNTNTLPLRDRESASSLPLFALRTPLGRSNKQTLQHTFCFTPSSALLSTF